MAPYQTLPVTAVAIACAAGMALAGYVMTALLLALMVALYSLAGHTERTTTRNVTLTAVILVAGSALIAEPATDSLALNVIGPVAWLLLPAALGTTARFRRAYLESVHARAEYAERTREEEARHRVAGERMRIARELHDVSAHHLALANAQATTAALLIRSHPAEAERMVNALGDTTAAALREMKATVGLLRQSGAGEDSSSPPRASPSSPAWSPRTRPPDSPSPSPPTDSRSRSPPGRTSPPTASCRRHCPTSPSTHRTPAWRR